MKVRHWMTPNPITVDPDTLVMDAQKIMSDNRIRRLPVVNKRGKVVGLVTLRNILEASPSEATTLSVHEMNYLLSKLKVHRVMQPDPICVSPEDSVIDVIRMGMERGMGAFPVVEKGKLVGIATETEIIRAMMNVFGDGKNDCLTVLLNVELDKNPGELSRIAAIVEKVGTPVLAIFSLPHRQGPGHRVVVRSQGTDPAGVAKALKEAGFNLED